MKYWKDMTSKYGFGDGDDVPPDAEVLRAIYVDAINRLCQKLNSVTRYEAWDRPGMHNFCMIVRCGVLEDRDCGEDEAATRALSLAEDMNLDDLAQVKVAKIRSYESRLRSLIEEAA